MNLRTYRNLLIAFVCSAFSVGVFAVETNSSASSLPPDAANGFLQVQQQLHDTQLAIERNQQQVEAETRRNAEDMAARIDVLQQIIATSGRAKSRRCKRPSN